MHRYIDIHTHQNTTNSNVFSIYNHIIGQEQLSDRISSSGIHPWYINENIESQFSLLNDTSQNSNVIAIGECGLDKICNTPWELQIIVFEKQIQLANILQKPLILHCVRAYNETLQILKKQKVNVPVIFHGVNKKTTLLQLLIQQGYYISLGEFICKGQHDDALKIIDLSKIFLETDNKSINIVDIYSYFCRVRNLSIEELKQQLHQNFSNVFNYEIAPQ